MLNVGALMTCLLHPVVHRANYALHRSRGKRRIQGQRKEFIGTSLGIRELSAMEPVSFKYAEQVQRDLVVNAAFNSPASEELS